MIALNMIPLEPKVHFDSSDSRICTNNQGCHAFLHTTQSPSGAHEIGVGEKIADKDWDLDVALMASWVHMKKMYGDIWLPGTGSGRGTSGPVFLQGGVQQYINRNRCSWQTKQREQQPRKGYGSELITFHDLPDSLQLHIFSFLSSKDLCQIASVCLHWQMLTSDNLLWQQLLQRDVHHWNIIGHTSYPKMYEECQSDWSYKEIYLRCSPEVNHLIRQRNVTFNQLSNILRSLWPRKTARVAMFGPGLESQTSSLVRKIIQEQEGPFRVTGMFAGQFEGVGSGFTMKMNNVTFNLMTLYTATRSERENMRQEERLQHNRLLAQQHAAEQGEISETIYELRPAIKDLCRTLDAFIFVVDASCEKTLMSTWKPELFAMVNQMWSASHVPVLVSSCVATADIPRNTCIDVVQALSLSQLSRPWQVHDCVVENLQGIPEAIEWVVEQSSRG